MITPPPPPHDGSHPTLQSKPGTSARALGALGASIAGSATGFLVGTAFFFLAYFRPWTKPNGFRQIFDPTGASILYAAVIAALSLTGWLLFELPVALRFRRGASHPRRLILYSTLTGAFLVTVAYTFLFQATNTPFATASPTN